MRCHRLDRRLVGPERIDEAHELVMECREPLTQRRLVVRARRAAGDIDEAVAIDRDDAPAGAAEPRIDAENANRAGHDGPVIARSPDRA